MASERAAVADASCDDPIDRMLGQLTLVEKVALLGGADMWTLPGIDRLSIQPLVMSDGPAGVRGASFVSGRSLSFPCASALGASWDPDLVAEVGVALGVEAAASGVNVLLAPTVNLHRHPLAGRNFECFSEDPYLTARMAVAYIGGVQSSRVACCVKHLVCNDSEFERHTISSEVDEVTLREIYLRPFDEAVRAGVWSVMAAYNKVNGTYASEHPWLLESVLRKEWSFDGVVVSDWFATHTTREALEAGLDVEMPGLPLYRGLALVEAVERGEVEEATIDRSVRRVLRLMNRTVGTGGAPPVVRTPIDPDRARALIRRAAARSMVLLKNERAVLPLVPERLRSVALIGPGADVGTFQGGGSAQVNPPQVMGILPALRSALGEGTELVFERGCVAPEWPQPLTSPMVHTSTGQPGIEVSYHLSEGPEEPALRKENARQLQLMFIGDVVEGVPNGKVVVRARAVVNPDETGVYTFSVVGTGRVCFRLDDQTLVDQVWDVPGGMVMDMGGQATRVEVHMETGRPRRLEVDYFPPAVKGLVRLEVSLIAPDPPDRIERAVAVARGADAVVVVAQSPPGWETEGRDRTTMTLPGRQDELIAAVGAANPNTIVVVNAGAPIAMPWIDQVSAVVYMWFPGQELGHSLADVLTGSVNPSGRLPTTFPVSQSDVAAAPYFPGSDGRVVYGERGDFGYRRDLGTKSPMTLFPFGYGLGYTTFTLETPSVLTQGIGPDAVYRVSVPVTHRAGPAGREVVQVYVELEGLGGPVLELQGFAGIELEPAETGTAVVSVPVRQLRRWGAGKWQILTGPFRACVGTSAVDLPFEIELPAIASPHDPTGADQEGVQL